MDKYDCATPEFVQDVRCVYLNKVRSSIRDMVNSHWLIKYLICIIKNIPIFARLCLNLNMAEIINNNVNYGDDNIRTLEGVEHIRLRPGMYIGRLGNLSVRLVNCTQFPGVDRSVGPPVRLPETHGKNYSSNASALHFFDFPGNDR